jgi:hypothetical protein
MKYLSSNNLQWLLFGFYRDALIVMLGQITRVPREYDDDFVSFGNRAANAVRDSSPRLERTLVSNDSNSFVGNLARRAALNMGEYMYAAETYLRLALKAQGQCRATLETLAVIKNPQPIAFVRQANIAHGPQQVNNGPAQPGEPSRAGKTEKQQNKLLEAENGERLELKTAGAASEADSSLETVGAVHRPKDSSR